MFDLPLSTHRYFVQPVSTKIHVKNLLMKRFLSFLSQVQKSSKLLPGLLLNLVKHDVRSSTGSNLRNIMLLTGKDNIEEVKEMDVADVDYAPVIQEDLWKIQMVMELIDVRDGQLKLDNFSNEELEDTLEFLCTS